MPTDKQSRRSILKKTGYAAGVSALLAGCSGNGGDGGDGGDGGSTQTTTATQGTTTSSKPETMQLTLGVPAPNETGIPTWYGLREVAEEEFNLDVTLNVLSDTNVLLQAMLSGQTEGSRDSALAIMPIIDQGKPLDYVYTTQRATDYVLVGRPGFDSLDDLTGKDARLAAASSSLRSFTTLQVVTVMRKAGVFDDPKTILDYIEPVGYSSARMTALLNGNVDMSPQHYSQWLQIKKENPDYNLISVFGKEIDNWLQIGYYTSPSILDEKREAWVRAVKAVMTATRRINSDYDLYKKKVRKYTPGGGPDDDALKTWWDFMNEINYHPENGGMDMDRVKFMVNLAKEVGIVSGDLSAEGVVDTSLVEDALADVGKSG